MTVLAWGNSMGDMAANVSMARRGLSNMAMTACYAGPLFNLLVGLGLGFWRRLGDPQAPSDMPENAIALTSTILLGAVFLVFLCISVICTGLLNQLRLPARFGWFLLALYGVFLTANVLRVIV